MNITKMRYKLTFVILYICTTMIYGQQDPNYTFYRYNMNLINPAYAGANTGAELGLNVRSQWASVKGAPETQSLFFGTSVGKSVGLGVSVINDRTFIENQTWVALDFSYKLTINENTDVFFGVKTGVNSYSANTDGLISYGIQSDPSLTSLSSSFKPNIGAGVYVKGKRFFASLSTPKILTSDRLENSNGQAILNQEKIHIYASVGYDFQINKKLLFKPSVMVRHADASPLSFELTAAFAIAERIEIGPAYRLDEGISGFFIFKATKVLHLGYAYETALGNSISSANKGTHEILFKLNL